MKQSPQKDLGDPEDSVSPFPFPEPYKFTVTCCSEAEYLVGPTCLITRGGALTWAWLGTQTDPLNATSQQMWVLG